MRPLFLGAVALAAAAASLAPSRLMAAPTFDPEAQAVADRAVEAYSALQAYHSKGTLQFQTTPADTGRPNGSAVFELKVQRPNRFFLDCTINEVKRKQRLLIVCDGKRLYSYDSITRFYTSTAAPKELPNITDLPVNILELKPLAAKTSPLADFIPQASHFHLGPSTNIGLTQVDTLQTAASVPAYDGTQRFNLYLGSRDHLIRGAHLTIVGKDQTKKKTITFTGDTTYALVEPNPRFNDAEFLFLPPAGARPLVTPAPKPKR